VVKFNTLTLHSFSVTLFALHSRAAVVVKSPPEHPVVGLHFLQIELNTRLLYILQSSIKVSLIAVRHRWVEEIQLHEIIAVFRSLRLSKTDQKLGLTSDEVSGYHELGLPPW
jgi:hypothetical protein